MPYYMTCYDRGRKSFKSYFLEFLKNFMCQPTHLYILKKSEKRHSNLDFFLNKPCEKSLFILTFSILAEIIGLFFKIKHAP